MTCSEPPYDWAQDPDYNDSIRPDVGCEASGTGQCPRIFVCQTGCAFGDSVAIPGDQYARKGD